MLGFRSQRPEREFGMGPDVLWLLNQRIGFVMEAKSNKEPNNPLTKKEYGQLLTSFEWFRNQYPRYEGVKITVHPNALALHEVVPSDTMVLTLNNLAVLVSHIRELLSELCSGTHEEAALRARCKAKLRELDLNPDRIRAKFLQPLSNVA